jgi:hypothetical protein
MDSTHGDCGVAKVGIVFVDRRPPVEHWVRAAEETDYSTYWEIPGPKPGIEGPDTDDVEEAIAWGRERASVVFVRLGPGDEHWYSAGDLPARLGGQSFPQWPPPEGQPLPEWPLPDYD